MIVRQFISWIRTAPAGERAEATRSLARAWLVSDLSQDDRAAAEGALLMLLDDPSPLVRRAMAEVFCRSTDAPAAIVQALAVDQASVSLPILEHSPLLIDADLVDIVATGNDETQCAIARRVSLPASVCAAVAEVGTASAALELIENPYAELAPFSWDRIVERHGHLAAIREAMLVLEGLPAATRSGGADMEGLVRHLRATGHLTAGLILRTLLSGNLDLFHCALAELSGLPLARVGALLHDRGRASLQALLIKAGLPESTFAAFQVAIDVGQEIGYADSDGAAARLRRRMVERVLTHCETDGRSAEPLLILLRRFATESAREEARLFCEELVAEAAITPANDDLIAA